MDKGFEKLVSTKINSSAEYNNFINALASTKEDNTLVCFLGAGTSILKDIKIGMAMFKILFNIGRLIYKIY